MNRELIVNQHLPFSVIFPEVHRLIKNALTRHFRVLQLRCVEKLLDVCSEKLTRYAIALPEHPKTLTTSYLNIEDLRGVGKDRIEGLVVHWHNEISIFDDPDITRAFHPKVFEYVKEQVFQKEPDVYPFYLSENDLAALTMLIIKNTNVFYKGNRWLSNDAQIARTFERWFNVPY